MTLTILFANPSVANGQEGLPPIDVGDEWVFFETWKQEGKSLLLEVTVTVLRTEGFRGYQAYVLEYKAVNSQKDRLVYTFTQWLTADWLELKEVWEWKPANITDAYVSTPPLRLLQAPLTVGKRWVLDSTVEVTTTNETSTTQTIVKSEGVERVVTSVVDVEPPAGKFSAFLIEQRHNGKLESRSWIGFEAVWPPLALNVMMTVKYEAYLSNVTISGELHYWSRAPGLERLRVASIEFRRIIDVAVTIGSILIASGYALYRFRILPRLISYTIQRVTRHPQLRRPRYNLLKPMSYLALIIGVILTLSGYQLYRLSFSDLSPPIFWPVFLELSAQTIRWGAGVSALGLVPLVFMRVRFSPTFLALSTSAGIWLISINFYFQFLGDALAAVGIEYSFWLHQTQVGVGLGLLAGGTLAYISVWKDWETLSTNNTKVFDYSVVGSTIVAIPFAFTPYGYNVALRIVGIGAVTWAIWHFAAYRLAAIWVARAAGTRARTGSQYVFYLGREEAKVPFKASGIFRRSVLPLAMAFGIIPPIISLANLVPSKSAVDLLEGALQYGATMVNVAWFVVPTVTIFAGPLKWILEESRIGRYDTLTHAFEKVSVGRLIEELIGVGSLLSLLVFSYEAGRTPELTLLLMFLIVVTLLPTSLLATTLYVRLSMSGHLGAFVERLRGMGISITRMETADSATRP